MKLKLLAIFTMRLRNQQFKRGIKMLNDELIKKLVELGFDFKSKPTFEELWERLPPYIIDNNTTYWLRLEKLKRYDRIGYFQDNDIFCENIIIEYDNSEIETITLSDLAAEMLIELKNRGMME